jgi:iron only hydrogenase large subunit-like protein
VLDPDLLRQRAGALYSIDSKKTLRKSYENPSIEELYASFLGSPGSEKAHELLHTHYHAREQRGER